MERFITTIGVWALLSGACSAGDGGHDGSTGPDFGAAGSGGALGLDCQIPDAQLLSVIHAGATLTFDISKGGPIQVGLSDDVHSEAPEAWLDQRMVTLETRASKYAVKVFARQSDPACRDEPSFEHIYDVWPAYDGAAGEPDALAVPHDAPEIVGWAADYVTPIDYGNDVDQAWRNPELALGEATGDTLDVVSLGNGGQITLIFDPPIADGSGADFAVFENGFSATFLELAYVEVSSNGEDFERFDSAYLGESAISAFGTQQASLMGGLAGKHAAKFGTPFDVALLRYRDSVQKGIVDLGAIAYVRFVDIVGDGSARDSFGHVIYDPTPTMGSAGFDLEAVAVLNAAQ